MAVNHYENFPVASFLLPARLRPAVRALYAFARGADDIADEGDASNEERIAGLNYYADQLKKIEANTQPDSVQFQTLQQVIQQYRLPTQPLHQLLSAFKQDVGQKRYDDFAQLLDYCDRSANPVGQLILHLYGAATPQNLQDSDAICSALQLINFWQDVAIDWEKQRIYIPLEDLHRFGVGESDIENQSCHPAWQALMQFEINRTRELMLSGSPLACRLPGRIGLELRGVVQGGLRILEKIELTKGNVFHYRPQLTSWDWLVIGWRIIWMSKQSRSQVKSAGNSI
ncbi:squalene synthase HpnC [Oxalobacteraceae bacterium GrIS 2.11]